MKCREKKGIALVASGILLGASIAAPVAGAALTAERSSQKIVVNGKPAQIEAYSIGGSNYVRLRDVGRAANFSVTYDQQSNTVRIDTHEPYTEERPQAVSGRVVKLPTDGSKYVPQAGDLIPCGDGALYEVKDTSRFENNCFASGPLPDLPEPTCDWSLFEETELPAPEVRHYVSDAGDNLYVRNLYETRRMQYTLYNALGRTPDAWRDGRPLAKVFLTIPAEYEAYTPVFWPWRAVELEKKAAAVPRGRFRCEAWDYYVDHTFMQTQYYIFVG
ncbi:MAG: hypothetical protein J5449_01955 [Oscillospiraceae bacterium]|nr:hypothetical protein [Oscillospiraceae bacterium]